jgi:hypothetical protein
MQGWLNTMLPQTIEYIVNISLKMEKWNIHELSLLPMTAYLLEFLGNLIFAIEKEVWGQG